MGARVGGNLPGGKSNERLESERGARILQALRDCSLGGPVKRIARRRRSGSTSAIYKIVEGETLSWLEDGADWLEACLAEPTKPRRDALAPVYLLAEIFGLMVVDLADVETNGDGVDDEAGDLAREQGELLEALIKRAVGGRLKAAHLPEIRKEAEDVVATVLRVVREAEATVEERKPRRRTA